MKKTPTKPVRKKSRNQLQVGNKVLIRTVTCFQVGRIIEANSRGYVLVDATWVADTGRFSDMLKSGSFSDQRAELEPFCDPVFVSSGAIVDATLFRGTLPVEKK